MREWRSFGRTPPPEFHHIPRCSRTTNIPVFFALIPSLTPPLPTALLMFNFFLNSGFFISPHCELPPLVSFHRVDSYHPLTVSSSPCFLISSPAAKPKNSADVVTVQAGTKSVVVAQCVAADSKPAATINWISSVRGNYSTSTTSGPDGTVTVRSEYRLVPTAEDNNKEVTCMVDQRTQDRQWTKSLRLSVECKHKHSLIRAHFPHIFWWRHSTFIAKLWNKVLWKKDPE